MKMFEVSILLNKVSYAGNNFRLFYLLFRYFLKHLVSILMSPRLLIQKRSGSYIFNECNEIRIGFYYHSESIAQTLCILYVNDYFKLDIRCIFSRYNIWYVFELSIPYIFWMRHVRGQFAVIISSLFYNADLMRQWRLTDVTITIICRNTYHCFFLLQMQIDFFPWNFFFLIPLQVPRFYTFSI